MLNKTEKLGPASTDRPPIALGKPCAHAYPRKPDTALDLDTKRQNLSHYRMDIPF